MAAVTPRTIPDIPNDDIVYFGQRTEPLFPISLVGGGLVDAANLKRTFGIDEPVGWISHVADESRHLYDFFNIKSELDRFLAAVRSAIVEKGAEYIDGLVAECSAAGESLVALAAKQAASTPDASKLTAAPLADHIEEFAAAAKSYCIFYTIAFFEKPEMDIVRDLVGRHARSDDEQASLFAAVATADKRTDTDLEQEAFLLLASQHFSTVEERRDAAAAHAAAFGWLGVRYFLGHWWAAQDVLERMDRLSPDAAKEMARDRDTARERNEQRVDDFKRSLDPHDAYLVDQARTMVYLRTQRADYFHHACAIVKPQVERVADVLGVSYHDLMHCTPDEVVAALRGEFDVGTQLEARKNDIVAYLGGGSISVLAGQEARDYVAARSVFDRRADGAEMFRGTSAYRGTVQGRARIVRTVAESRTVEQGDVLVAVMTTPDFIAAMERAAAFVTDEGGILCHAAIVAREMHKPCVIATKIATQVLKDGDLVEVDADSGVVRVLEHRTA